MSVDDSKAKLLSILQSHGTPLGLDDIQWAFESESTKDDLIAWIEEYLDEPTLLTRDELELYNSLSDTTKLELSSASHETVPLLDRDFKEAIAALKSSTSAIENHAKVLETQRELLSDLRKTNSKKDEKTAPRHAQERSALTFAIEDMAFTIDEQLKECEDQTSKSLSTLSISGADQLAADDKILEALANLPTKILDPSIAKSVNHAELERWLQSLAALKAGTIRLRIDRVLVQANSANSEALGQEAKDLLAEIETLKDELESVAQMSVGHELRKPLLAAIEANEGTTLRSRNEWSEYTLRTLEYLIARLEQGSVQASNLRSYANALVELRGVYSAINAEAKAPEFSAAAQPPVSRQRGESSAASSSSAIVSQALRRLNIKPTNPTQALSELSSLSQQSRTKLRSQYQNAEASTLDSLAKSLAPMQKDALSVLREVHSHSQFNAIHLSHAGSEAEMKDLAAKIDKLKPKIAGGELS